MLLNVPYNWDMELLTRLADYKEHIASFYASVPSNICGNLRHPDSVPKIDIKSIKQHIDMMHAFGAEFNHLANSTCLGNNEFINKNEVYSFFQEIDGSGADWVVLANPFLISFVRKHFPRLKIKISLCANLDSLQKMSFFMDKVEAISLPDAVNRNFALLKTFPTHKIKIELLANNLCLLDCPIGAYHANYASHNSQCINPTISRLDEYPMMWCTTEKINHPLELIKSPWIRPEDIKAYENIGFTHFKISGREKSTDWIVQRVKAYSERRYSGNVLDFLNPFLFFYPKHTPGVVIDNTKLDGFISFFEEEKCDKYCDKCAHCKKYYDRAVSITGNIEEYKRFVKSSIDRLEEVQDLD